MIIFYRSHSDSPNMRKISIMLEEIGLPYTTHIVNKQSNGQLADYFTQINPNATVPAMVDKDTGISLFESGAILYYLAEKTRKLMPLDLQGRAEVVKWLVFEAANMCPTMIELYHYLFTDSGEIPDFVLQRYKDKLARYCAIIDKQLVGREYLCAGFSIADIALYPWTTILEDMAEINLNDYQNMKTWAAAIGNRYDAQLTAQTGS